MDPKKMFVTFCYWRLFLMQSKKYKDLCGKIEKFDLNFGERESLLIKNPYDDIDYILYDKFIKKYQNDSTDCNFSSGPDVDVLISVYTMFQDVFIDSVCSFKQRVRIAISFLTEEGYEIFEPAYSKLSFMMFKMLKDHNEIYGQEMTGHELACQMSNYLEFELNGYEYLRFQPRECSPENILENVPFLITCYNGDASNTKYPVKLEMLGAVKPITFRQALKVHKLRQEGMDFHEIARKVVPHLQVDGGGLILQKNAYNKVLRLSKKAEILIANAESGVFPGEY